MAKAAKVKKAKKVAVVVPVVTPVVVPEVKPEKVAKAKIDVTALILPADATMKVMGTCVKFSGKNGHGYIKGRRLEISNVIDSLKDRVDVISKENAAKFHLGKSKGFIKVVDTADLQAVLDLYLG